MAALVIIPVSRLSRKILSAKYPTEPAQLTHHDLLFQQLCYQRALSQNNARIIQNNLTDQFKILLNNNLASKIKNHLAQCGYHLHLLHRDQMMLYIEALVNSGMQIKQAVTSFYSRYELADDDFDTETCIKYFQRFQKKAGKSGKKISRTVLQNSRFLSDHLGVKLPKEDVDLDVIIVDIFSTYARCVNHVPAKLEKQLRVYVYFEIGQRKWGYISAKLQMPRQTIYRSIASFTRRMDKDRLLRSCLQACLGPLA
jgi:hypothetical protein